MDSCGGSVVSGSTESESLSDSKVGTDAERSWPNRMGNGRSRGTGSGNGHYATRSAPISLPAMDHPMDCSPSPSTSASSSSSSSSSIHPASLVDSATHSPALLELVDFKISKPVIDYLVDSVAETVDFAMGRPSPSFTRGRPASRRPELAKFTSFATTVLSRAEVTMPVVLASLVYIDRAKPHLHIALEEWALERVFLGALIVASKYLNDSTLKNVHWAICTGVFGKRDIGRIEREFLDVLDFELSVTEADLLSHHAGLSAAVSPSPSPSSRHSVEQVSPRSPHKRHHQRSSVPALEPSSPESSDGSSSPQTPSTLHESSPESYQPKKPQAAHKYSAFSDILRFDFTPHFHDLISTTSLSIAIIMLQSYLHTIEIIRNILERSRSDESTFSHVMIIYEWIELDEPLNIGACQYF
ncbi:hypothetical protein ARMGADRAFT_1063318 [Armillaria gallica]|uniref:Cyclin N-terminal domain-containing protein n=1 Tax=Armillaria gallica TaxID=47427 RepID=A0A2H3DVR9_ARMGA|nr:hypothetical protein ARMGADRAFT_1063318 [Armillaria gallica]